MHDVWPLLRQTDFPPIQRTELDTLQVNLGYLCNQSCLHCHVNAGPKRKELMTMENIEHVIALLDQTGAKTLDLTGGAPEMNPHFKHLVRAARDRGVRVIDRCNLTILSVSGYEDLAEFLAQNHVDVVASLPCYLEDNVDAQRGEGVFQDSIKGLQMLNALGYGTPDSDLSLNLVYNPQGPVLPPSQVELQAAYKQHLLDQYGIAFNELFTLANMPIQRFGSTLVSRGQFDDYMQLLRDNYSVDNLPGVMCRSLISIDWEGYVYDCDFNQMLKMHAPLNSAKQRIHISELEGVTFGGQPIAIADHCYGCTAGQGSSCGGALQE